MSDRVLLNLLNELSKSDKMLGLPSILSLFRNELKGTAALIICMFNQKELYDPGILIQVS